MADALTQTLATLSLTLNRIVPIIQIVLGTFGNVMNILIFTQRSLRNNSCSTYFLALSINNLFALYVALLTRLLASGWNIDPSASSNVLCKLRIFFVYIALCQTQWFIVLASIDRFLSSCRSVRYRQLSNKGTAQKVIIVTVVIITIAHFHMPVWWKSDYAGSTLICNIFDLIYEIAFETFYTLFTCLLPPVVMTIFGVITIHNVRKIRSQVAPQNDDARNERLRSKDRQMIRMLLFQVLLNVLFLSPFTAINMYSTIEDNIETSPLSPAATAVYNFCANVFRLLNYCNPVIGFYIYTLTSRTFRMEMKQIFGSALIWLGLIRCLPESMRRNLFEQDQSLANNQSTLGTKTRAAFGPTKTMHLPSQNQSAQYNNITEEINVT